MSEKKTRKRPSRENIAPPEFEDAQSALLWFIIEQKGGPSVVAESVSLSPHLIYNWRMRGKVPLMYAVRLAKMLGVPSWGLCYTELSFQLGKSEDWEAVVGSYKLPKSIVSEILKLEEPDLWEWA